MFGNLSEYLIKELESGKRINMLLMSHELRWEEMKYQASYYKNLNVDTLGLTTLELTSENINNDYDIIVYYSSLVFRKNEYDELKRLARHISEEKNKRATIGYKYYNDEKGFEQVIIFSVIHEEEFEIVKDAGKIVGVHDLTAVTLKTANDLDRVKKKILEK